jgi:hypothetical protein
MKTADLVTSFAGSLRNRRARVLSAVLSLNMTKNGAIKQDPPQKKV